MKPQVMARCLLAVVLKTVSVDSASKRLLLQEIVTIDMVLKILLMETRVWIEVK